MKNKSMLFPTTLCLLLFLVACGPTTSNKKVNALPKGTYVGSSQSHGGLMEVEMVVDGNGNMNTITITAENDTESYAKEALSTLPNMVTKAQSLDIDAVSGATISSRAFLEATANAVLAAGGNPSDFGYKTIKDTVALESIMIIGVASEATINSTELQNNFKSHDFDAISVSSSGKETPLSAKGVLLADILESFGSSQAAYEAIMVSSTDGYAIEIPANILRNRDIFICYEVNGEPTSLRTIIPGERAMYWSKFISGIEVMGSGDMETIEINKIIFLETAIELAGETTTYKYHGAVGEAISTKLLMDPYITDIPDFVNIRSVDGLHKNERYNTFMEHIIMYSGEEDVTPMFTGPGLPEGMQVKQMVSAQMGERAFVSLFMVANIAEKADKNAVVHLSMKDFLVIVNENDDLLGDKRYTLTDINGKSVDIATDELATTILIVNENNLPIIKDKDLDVIKTIDIQ